MTNEELILQMLTEMKSHITTLNEDYTKIAIDVARLQADVAVLKYLFFGFLLAVVGGAVAIWFRKKNGK